MPRLIVGDRYTVSSIVALVSGSRGFLEIMPTSGRKQSQSWRENQHLLRTSGMGPVEQRFLFRRLAVYAFFASRSTYSLISLSTRWLALPSHISMAFSQALMETETETLLLRIPDGGRPAFGRRPPQFGCFVFMGVFSDSWEIIQKR